MDESLIMGESGQIIFNIVASVAAFLGGWVLNNLKQSIDHLQAADRELAQKIQDMEVLVAGDYVKRDVLQQMIDTLFRELDRIETKLDGKVDK